jgi:hypothetical protein
MSSFSAASSALTPETNKHAAFSPEDHLRLHCGIAASSRKPTSFYWLEEFAQRLKSVQFHAD